MIEVREGLRLALKALGEGRVFRGLRRQDLEGHQPVELPLPRLVHGPHSAVPSSSRISSGGKYAASSAGWGATKRPEGLYRTVGATRAADPEPAAAPAGVARLSGGWLAPAVEGRPRPACIRQRGHSPC